jgi:hypothetical protein
MIRENTASLVVSSSTKAVGEVAVLLGLDSTSAHELGEETPHSRRIPPGSAPRHWRDSRWVLTVKDDGADDSGFGSVRVLLSKLAGREDAIRALKSDFDVWIVWSGSSDSDQGGFVIPSDIFAQLAALDCDIMANANLQDGAPP